MNILVLNAGSSSIKYRILRMPTGEVLGSGAITRIGEGVEVPDHSVGFERLAQALESDGVDSGSLTAVGHRVVHGGSEFSEPTLVDEDVIEAIRKLEPLAPLHNPANLLGIEAAMARFPDRPHVAVFDTAFHASLPARAYRYAIPKAIYEQYDVRRYGFHGTSHRYVMTETARHLGKSAESLNMIVLHLGNGASAAAIAGGKCVDTSMGMTPLEGLVMGTRSGDIDPAIVFFLVRKTGATLDDVKSMLNRDSGLKGLCGDNDVRQVSRRAADNDPDAQLALDVYCYRIRKFIGAYTAALGSVDAIVFTAGIGENQPLVRAGACEGLEGLGIFIDESRNKVADGSSISEIQADQSATKVLVVPTNEELELARQVVDCISR